MKPLVSCIMATKDRMDFVKHSLQYFLHQSYPNLELIVVDHGTDKTATLIAELNDPRIRYEHIDKPDLVTGDVKNHGFSLARGHYIAVWDDDDWYHPSRITLQVRALEQAKANACYLKRELLVWRERLLFKYSQVRPWENSLVVRTSSLLPYAPLQRGGDKKQTEQMLIENRKLVYLDIPDLYSYRIHTRNVWHTEHFERMVSQATSVAPDRVVQQILVRTS